LISPFLPHLLTPRAAMPVAVAVRIFRWE